MSLLAFGDMGESEYDRFSQFGRAELTNSLRTVSLMRRVLSGPRRDEFAGVLHIGDLSYARGYAYKFDVLMNEIEPIATSLPYQVLLGNHEADWPGTSTVYNVTDSGGECGVAARARFPKQLARRPWYSFDVGPVHCVFMSTEHNFSLGSEQYEFIVRDLAAVDRAQTPWLLFAGHRPAYIDSTFDGPPFADLPVARALRATFAQVWLEHRVDLVLWGHHHSAQRTCPVHRERCDENATTIAPNHYLSPRCPVHAVIGFAGADFSQNVRPHPPDWIEYVNDDTHGLSVLRFSLNSAESDLSRRVHAHSPPAETTTLEMQFLDENGGLMHQFAITKPLEAAK
jgi:hypothetical protein